MTETRARAASEGEDEMLDTRSFNLNAAPALEPVQPGERILVLDVLRGFALFGVLPRPQRKFSTSMMSVSL